MPKSLNNDLHHDSSVVGGCQNALGTKRNSVGCLDEKAIS